MEDEDHEMNLGYNDGNRAFVQALMARGSMNGKEVKKIIAAIFTAEGTDTLPEDVTSADIEPYISAAADALSPFDYEIRRSQHQVSKELIYAIVNSNSDLVTQMATTHTAEEISYMRKLLDAMFETYNTRNREVMAITSMQALEKKVLKGDNNRNSSVGIDGTETQTQSTPTDKGLTRDQAEDTLRRLVAEGWFERSSEGWYTLTPRALMELQNWLIETYNDPDEPNEWQRIKKCLACRDIITVGQRCSNAECNARLHDICHHAFWVSHPERKCPKCRTDWDGRHWVGQKVVTTTENYLRAKRRSGQGHRSRDEAMNDGTDEEAEEEINDEEGEEDE